MIELTPERQAAAEEARKRAVLLGIEAVRQLFIAGEPVEESDYEGEKK